MTMKEQIILDEDDITVEALIEKHKFSVNYTYGEQGLLPFWTVNLLTSKGVNRGSAAGYTLRAAVEAMVKILPKIIILPEDR